LKTRWKEIDQLLTKHYNKYRRLDKDLQDNLQDIFNRIDYTFENATKPISNTQRERLDRLYLKWQNDALLGSNMGYRVRRVLSKRNITNLDVLKLLVEIEYIKRDKELDEMTLFKQIAETSYQQGSKEVGVKPKRISWLTSFFLLELLKLPSKVTGYIWKEYQDSTILYNANQIVNQTLINLQLNRPLDIKKPEYKVLFESQQKRYLNKKKGIDKFSGALDLEVSYIVNNVILQSYIDGGINKVRHISVLDEVTSKMCESLDNQVFFINKENRFFRYSAFAKTNVLYVIKGLESGINLPPINDSFHYCRSTIYPEKE
jgi:hypothetical protein